MSGRRAKRAKPVVHRRDHEHGGVDPVRIVYEDVGEGGAGGTGIQFDTDPQEGGFLTVTVTDGPMTWEATGSGDINMTADENVNLSSHDGVNITSDGGGGIILDSQGGGDIWIQPRTNWLNIVLGSGAQLHITGLPTSAPVGGSGKVWNDGGTLKIT